MAEATQQETQQQENPVEPSLKSAWDVLAYYQMELSVTKDGINPRFNKAYATLGGINDALKEVQKKLVRVYGIFTAFYFKSDTIEIRDGVRVRVVVPVLTTPFGEIEGRLEVCEGTQGGGLDASQISGKASTYARKYAESAFFAIGDQKDADDDKDPYPEYPDGEFNAKCLGCGQISGGLTRENVGMAKCPNCGTVGKWNPA